MADEPSVGIDTDKLLEQTKLFEQYINQYKNRTETEEVQKEEEKDDQQAIAEQEDPRNAKNWGFKAIAKEGQSILSGGLQDTASSIATFPERTADALSGEMQREREETGTYRPEWDPFTNYDNPIVTKTWWGKLLRGTVHFGSMAAAIIPTAKATAARTGISIAALGTNSLLRAAAVGATSDLISKESDGHNALGALRNHYSWIDTPISTKDTDHPIMMKFKNIVEGMGIGLVFDGAAMLIGGRAPKVIDKVKNRNDSIKKQTIEKGLIQLRRGDKEFRAEKNAPLAQPHQGAHVSEEPIEEVVDRLAVKRNEWMADDGSTGSVTTAVQRERIALEANVTEEVVEDTLRKLWSTDKFQVELKKIRSQKTTWGEAFGDAILAHQRITNGRNAADMTADEYLKELVDSQKDIVDGVEILASRDVIAADLVTASLLSQLRDTGIAARELTSLVDITDADGPAKQIADTLLAALAMTKRARAFKGLSLKKLDNPQRVANIKETLSKDMADTREAIMTMLRIAKDEPDNNLLNAVFEAFSSMKEFHSLDDFDHWARKMIRGGELNKFDRTGAAIRELEGVFIHSILSGPKTSARAIIGTSTATFLRPFSTAIGATMRYPFTGDSATVKASLASLNAMMQAIPESFTLFKTRLNSYWSGDIATVKSRFSEYTRADDNWEILRRWAEDSGRASDGDRAAFALANGARWMNNNSLFTYSTKLMAATDDAFAYILGRAKMREKAMRNALDLKGAGYIGDIDPQVLRAYEDDFYSQVFDGEGNILDEATKFARKEVTLTQDLTGFAKGLNDVFTANPWAKPFFLFARTGVNGLSLTAKHTPGFNFLVKEFNDIAKANINNLEAVSKYGITNATELANAKALQQGRLAIGSSLIGLASWSYMSGNLTGNGPTDRQKRQVWLDAGWKPRSIKLGGIWVGYDSFEPFNQIFASIGDVGDHSQLMGEEWTEKQFLKYGLVLGQAIASKSYLAGMQQFVDLFGGRPGQAERILAGLLNNQVPLAGLRNDIGKVLNPYTKELGSGIDQAIRNRNQISEYLPGEDLPIKYDMLKPNTPIKDYDFLTRVYNMFSPVQLSLDYSPGREFLFNSGYDLRVSTYFAPDGTDLSKEPHLRSDFQRNIGQENPEHELNKLAKNPKALASLAEMQRDIANGDRGKYESKDYWHNRQIARILNPMRERAWARVKQTPRAQKVIEAQQRAKLERQQKQMKTTYLNEVEPLLNMYK